MESDTKVGQLAGSISSLKSDLSTLSRQVVELKDAFNGLHNQLDGAVKTLAKLKANFEDCKKQIKKAKKEGKDTVKLQQIVNELEPIFDGLKQRLVPATGSIFVRLLLGRVNVKEYKDGERLRLKTEYEKFRSRTNPFIIFMCAIQLIFPSVYIFQAIFQLWLMYYYVTLALREQILRVNGSNINSWWIFHHYICILMSMVLLTWFWQSESYLIFYPHLLYFGICQAVVQILMNRYQIGRLYNLVARGKATKMDVTAEIIDRRYFVTMPVLIPFLMVIQGFIFYNGYAMIHYAVTNPETCEWQVLPMGIFFWILSMGNVYTNTTNISKKFLSSVRT